MVSRVVLLPCHLRFLGITTRMRKRRRGERDGGRAAKRRRQHLYLVFDDWSWGYTIRKVNLSKVNLSGSRRLPRAFFRLEAPRGLPQYFVSGATSIMAMQPREPWDDDFASASFFPIFDVRSRSVIFGPGPYECLWPIYFPIGDKLFVLDVDTFYLLGPPLLEPPGCEHLVSPWRKLPRPRFSSLDVTGYAVHPDGRTILVSTIKATFTFDTVALKLEWKRNGKWSLPFAGRGHFVSRLDAFVGLSKDPDNLGHLCSCDATSTSSADTGDAKCPAPAWKIGKEKLFGDDPAERHVGATLVYMGRRSRFCLVQSVFIEKGHSTDHQEGHGCYLYRVTTFSPSYDKKGDLTTGKSRRVRYYNIPKATTQQVLRNPVAFWL